VEARFQYFDDTQEGCFLGRLMVVALVQLQLSWVLLQLGRWQR
jgi:hypothetical protein